MDQNTDDKALLPRAAEPRNGHGNLPGAEPSGRVTKRFAPGDEIVHLYVPWTKPHQPWPVSGTVIECRGDDTRVRLHKANGSTCERTVTTGSLMRWKATTTAVGPSSVEFE